MNEPEQDTFPSETVHAMFKHSWGENNVKISKDALALSCEFLRLFTAEAVHRASDEAEKPGVPKDASRKIDIEHLEIILPQLVLDF
ncbi:centromere protein X [Phycomyces nitens]|nr:centromere protein X [Phycomyces nitens]